MRGPNQDEIEHALLAVLELPQAEQAVYLAQQPTAIREEVASLLAALRRSGDFLEDGAGVQITGPDLTRRMQAVLARIAAAASESGRTNPAALASANGSGPMPLKDGTRVGPYRIEGLLGKGGMGMVYRAVDTRLQRAVAVKFLVHDVADARGRRRFQREAQMASALNHPHLMTVHDVGEHDGVQYLVTEYLDGGTLNEWAKSGQRTWQRVVELLAGVADGLATAHAAGILHCDVKPSNILIHPSGYAKLADFGLAKLAEESGLRGGNTTPEESSTYPGMVIGTVAYMSPEQASGRPLDARSDIFSFGVVLYEMLARRNPFEGATDREVLQRIIHDVAPPLRDSIPRQLRTIVEKTLEKDPANRYQSMQAMVADLRRCDQNEEAVVVRPERRSAKWRAAVVIVVALMLIAAAAAILRSRSAASRARSKYVRLTNFADSVTSPALSRDGRTLTFIRGSSSFVGAGEVWVKFLPDGQPRQITRDDSQKMSPAFSPDGSRIAYTTVDHGGWNTWEAPVLGGDPKLLLPNAAGLVWQGKNKVLFSEIMAGGDGNHMKIVAAEENRAGARDVYIPRPKGAMAHRSYPSPDGKWALVAEMDERGAWLPCRLVTMDGSSNGTAVGPPGAACWFATWSPDGKWMYLNSNAGGGFHIWRQRFFSPGGLGEPEQITSGATEEEGIAMSPDGRSFITAVGLKQGSVWARGSNGDRQVSLEGVARQPRFTPDGKRLLYLVGMSDSPERRDLWIADLNSGRTEPLLPGFSVGGDDVRPPYDISPDGRLVVLEARDREGKRRLWLAPVNRQSPPRQITDVEGDAPLFGPDGAIYFRAREADYGFAYRVREDGTGLQKVSDHPVYSTVSISPKGGHLIVYARAGEHAAGVTLALPLSGGEPIQIYGRYTSLKWSRDGRDLFLSAPIAHYSGQSGKTYVLPLPLGRSLPHLPQGGFSSEEAIARTPGVRVIDSPDVAPGPTREVFAFSRVTVQRNMYRVLVP